jgi:hypothetical protein
MLDSGVSPNTRSIMIAVGAPDQSDVVCSVPAPPAKPQFILLRQNLIERSVIERFGHATLTAVLTRFLRSKELQ